MFSAHLAMKYSRFSGTVTLIIHEKECARRGNLTSLAIKDFYINCLANMSVERFNSERGHMERDLSE